VHHAKLSEHITASRETQRAHHLRLGCSILRFSGHADVQLQRDLSKSKPTRCRRSGRWQLGSNQVSPFDSIKYGLDVSKKAKFYVIFILFLFTVKFVSTLMRNNIGNFNINKCLQRVKLYQDDHSLGHEQLKKLPVTKLVYWNREIN